MKIKKIDFFAMLNLGLFLLMCVFRYYARFIHYRGIEHIEEFFVYASVIICAILLLWWVFRHYPFDAMILVLLQIGIVMHFSGAFVQMDGGRLYDAHVLGIQYDKYVHFVNAFSATLLVSRLFQIQGIALTRVNSLLLMLVVLGLGAVIEIVEYIVVLTVPSNGVGGYDNNMQDLMANFCGALGFLILRPALARLQSAIFGKATGQAVAVGLGALPERVV